MATRSFKFHERLKRFRCALKTILQRKRNRSIGFPEPSEERDPFSKQPTHSESVASLMIPTAARAGREPSMSADVKVLAAAAEPYLTWLSYTLGITDQAQNFPSVEVRQVVEAVDDDSLTLLIPEVIWPFDEFPVADISSFNAPKQLPPQPTFHPFMHLPFEIRMKIYQLTITPRLVHYNSFGAHTSRLKIRQPIPLLMRICQESRAEGYRLYRTPENPFYAECLKRFANKEPMPQMSTFNYTGTWPVNFSAQYDMLLWTRYWTVKDSFRQDANRLLQPETLQFVRKFTILIDFWNRIVSNPPQYDKVYAAIRNAPNLQMLCLVDNDPPRSTRMYGQQMKLKYWDGPECERKYSGLVRWEKYVRVHGKERAWKEWDSKILGEEEIRRVVKRKSPVIRFAKIVLERPNKKKVKRAPQLEEW